MICLEKYFQSHKFVGFYKCIIVENYLRYSGVYLDIFAKCNDTQHPCLLEENTMIHYANWANRLCLELSYFNSANSASEISDSSISGIIFIFQFWGEKRIWKWFEAFSDGLQLISPLHNSITVFSCLLLILVLYVKIAGCSWKAKLHSPFKEWCWEFNAPGTSKHFFAKFY